MAEYEHEYILALDNLPHGLSDIGDYLDYMNVRTKKYMGNTLGERIVRCRNCRYFNCIDKACERMHWPSPVPLNGFCAWGEERHG